MRDCTTLQQDGKMVPIEVVLMNKTSHIAGVMKIYDFLEKSDSYVIVMERPSKSKDLFDYITKRVYLKENQARKFFKQIVETVLACEEAGVLHLDLKDENIVVDLDTEQLKIIDFGSGALMKDDEFTSFDGLYQCYLF